MSKSRRVEEQESGKAETHLDQTLENAEQHHVLETSLGRYGQ